MEKIKEILAWVGAVVVGGIGFTVFSFLMMALQNLVIYK